MFFGNRFFRDDYNDRRGTNNMRNALRDIFVSEEHFDDDMEEERSEN